MDWRATCCSQIELRIRDKFKLNKVWWFNSYRRIQNHCALILINTKNILNSEKEIILSIFSPWEWDKFKLTEVT